MSSQERVQQCMQRCMKPVAETEQLVTQELEHFQVHSHNRYAKLVIHVAGIPIKCLLFYCNKRQHVFINWITSGHKVTNYIAHSDITII